MKLSEITKVSQLFEILDWDLDGDGMVITDGELLAEAIAATFPELEMDMFQSVGMYDGVTKDALKKLETLIEK
jgi:hypothetical protein